MTDWLDRLPSGWSVANPRHHFRERREASRPDDAHLTPSQHHGVLTQAEYMAKTGTKVVLNLSAPDNMKHVKPGDFIAHLRSFQGGLEKSDVAGKVSTAYTVIEPLPSVEPRFYRWVVKSPAYIQVLASSLEQLRDGQSIKFGDFAAIRLPKPPLDEQRRIADFLDDRVARIDQIITARTQQLDLMAERMSATITAATTPADEPGWRLMKFSRVARINDGLVDPEQEPYSQMPLVAPNHIEKATGRLLDLQSAKDQGAESGKGFVRQGQIIYSKIRPALRKVTFAPLDCLCSADAYALTPEPEQALPEYLLAVMLGDFFTQQVIEASERVAMPKVNRETLGDVWVWLPSLQEQEVAARKLMSLRHQSDAACSGLRGSVSRLQEYKQSLITAAVTGEIDVTTAGSGVPG